MMIIRRIINVYYILYKYIVSKFGGLTFLDLEKVEPFAISDPCTRRKLSCKSNVESTC